MHWMRQMNSIDSIYYELKYLEQMQGSTMQLYETYILSYFKMNRVQKQHKLYSLKSFIASGGLDKIEKCKLGGGGLLHEVLP